MSRTLLEVRELSVRFGGKSKGVAAVENVSYSLSTGETLAIIGESGAGKSLSCLALIGLVPPRAAVGGSVRLEGKELIGLPEHRLRCYRGRDIAVAFQDSATSLNPTMRIGAQIAEAVRAHGAVSQRDAHEKAVGLLSALHLPAPARHMNEYPHQLSGGMRQRVMLAIALAGEPKILVADEPTASLDPASRLRFLDLLQETKERLDLSVIMISHDLPLIRYFADNVLVMRNGRVARHVASDQIESEAHVQRPTARACFEPVATLDSPDTDPGLRRPTDRRPAKRLAVRAPNSALPALLEARNLVQEYRGGWSGDGERTRALDDVSFDMRAGETLAVVGASGAGKSALARTVLQVPRPTNGSVWFDGSELTKLRGRRLRDARAAIQMVFQDPRASLDSRWTIANIVEEPLVNRRYGNRASRRRRVEEVLEQAGLNAARYAHRRPGELSGGQCQRVAIARSLALQPKVLILDEALSSLDAGARDRIVDLLEFLKKKLALAYLFISHDLALVRRMSDRVAVMRSGKLCETGDSGSVLDDPTHACTRELVLANRHLHADVEDNREERRQGALML